MSAAKTERCGKSLTAVRTTLGRTALPLATLTEMVVGRRHGARLAQLRRVACRLSTSGDAAAHRWMCRLQRPTLSPASSLAARAARHRPGGWHARQRLCRHCRAALSAAPSACLSYQSAKRAQATNVRQRSIASALRALQPKWTRAARPRLPQQVRAAGTCCQRCRRERQSARRSTLCGAQRFCRQCRSCVR